MLSVHVVRSISIEVLQIIYVRVRKMLLVSKNSAISPRHIDSNVTVSQWQQTRNISGKYLCFRWVIFMIFSFIITCSLADVGRNKMAECKGNFLLKWPIYLTHWTQMICLVQSLIAAALTSLAYVGKKCDVLMKICNPINAIATTLAFTMWVHGNIGNINWDMCKKTTISFIWLKL